MKKIILIALGVLLVAGVTGGGYYLWHNQEKFPQIAGLVKKIEQARLADWGVYPNYSSPRAIIKSNNVTWMGSFGGILRFDEKTKAMHFYNKSNGLLGNQVWSMIEADGKIWFTMQDEGVQSINLATSEIIDSYPAKSFVPRDFQPSFGAFGNPMIYKDPYGDSLWLATMKGIYRYDKARNAWNYMQGGLPSNVYELIFTESEIYAKAEGAGVFYLDKNKGEINDISQEKDYLFSGYTDFLAGTRESLFVSGRPKEYTSCDDKDKRASIIEKYTVGKGWDKMSVLNEAINYDEVVKSLMVKDNQLWVYIMTKDCSGSPDEKQFFILKYDVVKDQVLERVEDQVGQKYIYSYSIFDQIREEEYGNIVKQIEKETGVPAQKSIAFIDKSNRLLLRTGDYSQKDSGYAYFDPSKNAYDFSLWDKIKTHQEIVQSEFSFEIMPCNKHNDPNKEDLVFIREYYMGMGGPREEAIYAYSKANNSLERHVLNRLDDKKYYPNYYGALICNSSEVVYPSNKGLVSLNWMTKKETVYSDNFKPFSKSEEGYIEQTNMDYFDGTKSYFLAEGGKIGYFDIEARKYVYDFDVPGTIYDPIGNYYQFDQYSKDWVTGVTLTHAADNKLYFYVNTEKLVYRLEGPSGGSNPSMHFVLVFDILNRKWTPYPIGDSDDRINDVKFWGNKIWVNMGQKKGTIIIDAEGNQKTASPKDGMLDEFGTMTPSPDALWFSDGDFNPGIWMLSK